MFDAQGNFIETTAEATSHTLHIFNYYMNIIFPVIGTIAAILLIIWLIRHWK